MDRFTVVGSRYKVVREDGTTGELPWPSHADSIINAIRAHGGKARSVLRTYRSWGDDIEREVIPSVDGRFDRTSDTGFLNDYLLQRGLESGLLIENEDGSVSLSEFAELHDEFEEWVAARRRHFAAGRELARDFEIGSQDNPNRYRH